MPVLFDSTTDEFPEHFEKWVQKLKLRLGPLNDFVYLCVLYNVLEHGFIICCEQMDEFETYDFNINALKCAGELELKDVYRKEKGYFITTLRLGPKNKRQKIVLTGHPSNSQPNDFMVVNLRTVPHNEIASICIQTSRHCPRPQFDMRKRREFSLDVKSNLSWPIKSCWMQKNLKGNYPHYDALPYPAMRIIKMYMYPNKRNRRTHKILPVRR